MNMLTNASIVQVPLDGVVESSKPTRPFLGRNLSSNQEAFCSLLPGQAPNVLLRHRMGIIRLQVKLSTQAGVELALAGCQTESSHQAGTTSTM